MRMAYDDGASGKLFTAGGSGQEPPKGENMKLAVMHDRRLVHDFAAAILEKRQPEGTLEQALLVQKLIDAVYRSSDTGGAVSIRL